MEATFFTHLETSLVENTDEDEEAICLIKTGSQHYEALISNRRFSPLLKDLQADNIVWNFPRRRSLRFLINLKCLIG